MSTSRTPFHAYVHGDRVPFDPDEVRAELTGGCILCGWPIVVVGVFTPETPDMVAVVLRLRTHPLPDATRPGKCYGLCLEHAREPNVTDKVEAKFRDKASRVVLQ